MALAATTSPELAQRVTFASASEMKMVGINWAYVLYHPEAEECAAEPRFYQLQPCRGRQL